MSKEKPAPLAHAWPRLRTWLLTPGQQPPLILSSYDSETLTEVTNAARLLAVCEQPGEYACGICRPCRHASAQTHQDILEITTDKATITIKALRAVFDTLSRTALTPRRIVILHDAEKLSLPAANALLKSLEEPTPSTRWLLATRWPRRLLPTIRSRCQSISLVVPPDERDTGGSNPNEAWPTSLAARLAKHHGPQALSDIDLNSIASALSYKLHTEGPTPILRRAFLRLRDYHLIRSRRGNEKLGREVLLVSLP